MRLTTTRLALCLFFSLSVVSNANAQHTTVTAPPIYQVEFSQVSGLPSRAPDKIISYGEHQAQFVEFWHAQGVEIPAPAIVLVHGGCWLNAFGVDHIRGAATALADDGFAVWSVEYRRLGDEGGGWPNSRDDIVTAIDMLHTASPPSIDPNHIFVAGHSAGGHLALLAVERTQLRPLLTIGLAAITDLQTYSAGEGSCQQAATGFLATAKNEQADKLNVSKSSTRQRVLFYGQADSIVDPAQAKLGTTKSVMADDAGHFDFIHPDTKAWNIWQQYIKHALGE